MSAPFHNAYDALTYIAAGHARVTLVSKKTGVRFTYRVTAPKVQRYAATRALFVSLLVGPSNETDWRFIGTIFVPAASCQGPATFRRGDVSADAPSVRAIGFALFHLGRGAMPPDCEVWHEGTCGKCGRALTVPKSVALGFGPECLNMARRSA